MNKNEMQVIIDEQKKRIDDLMEENKGLRGLYRSYFDLWRQAASQEELVREVIKEIHKEFDATDWASDAGSENLPRLSVNA